LVHRLRSRLQCRGGADQPAAKFGKLEPNCLLLLNSIKSSNEQNYPAFWPDGRRAVKYGPVFTVEPVSQSHYPNIKSWIFRINKKVSICLVLLSVRQVAHN